MLPCRDQQPEATMRRSWTPAERRMSRVGTKSGRGAIGREQLRIRKPQWRWTCQLGSICVLKHVHLEERRSECFCFLTLYSLCSSDAPTTRASARSAQRGQTFSEHPQNILDFITPQLSFPAPSVSAGAKTTARLRNCSFFQAHLAAITF